jgi:carbon dioxide concentrating mechanism protein CcmN
MVQTQEQRDPADYYIGNNVEVSADVVIASGAVLDAAPGCRLLIEPGVCIGRGVVVQVYGGNLTLASGVNLGKEVLLVGTGFIGARACIGAESTLLNPLVPADAVIPARSLIGEHGQSLPPPAAASTTNGHHAVNREQTGQSPPATASAAIPENRETAGPSASSAASAPAPEQGADSALTAAKMVYGREQVMQLMKTLFPHRDLLNGNSDNTS